MSKIVSSFFLILMLLPTLAAAQSVGAKAKRFIFELHALGGWGSSQMGTDSGPPTIGSTNMGASLGVNIKKISLGASFDYRIMTQHSDVDVLVGNRRGTFTSPMSLFLRINFSKVRFGFQIVNSGSYILSNRTADGKVLAYTDPSGFKFDIIFNKLKNFTPVIFYETVNFTSMDLDGIKTTLPSNLTYLNYGVGVKYEF